MRSRLMVLGLALTLMGASCTAKTTVSTGNTNVTVSTNTSATGSFTTSSNTVTVSSSGVSPASISVPSGTTVTFKNTDSILHVIASDPHPSHSDLPGFDAETKNGIQPGDSYSFTFVTQGTFGYHDHQDPFNTKYHGTVIVQ